MEQTIRKTRIQLDAVFVLTGKLTPSREVSLAKTHFETSKMMLGKVLGELGTANPYPESKNPESSKIEPTADTADRVEINFADGTDQIARVKLLRQDAEQLCKSIEDIINVTMEHPHKWKLMDFLKSSYLECQKGMRWLGMELGRIRDTATEDTTQRLDAK